MKKILARASFLFLLNVAGAVPLTYDLVRCTQACGLTPNTNDTVYIEALNGYDFKTALATQCHWRGMSLQREMNCTSNHYDYSKNENAVRCNQGINTTAYLCRATVNGYGFAPNSRNVAHERGDKNAANFSTAMNEAMKECSAKFIAQGITMYQCFQAWFAPNSVR